MGVIRTEDIVGFFVGEECVCCDCIQPNEEAEVTQEEVITQRDVEDEDSYYFCDRHKGRI